MGEIVFMGDEMPTLSKDTAAVPEESKQGGGPIESPVNDGYTHTLSIPEDKGTMPTGPGEVQFVDE
jgi:hypothetical protein